jgi:uncharacterized damage-inducible protein DinB
MLSRPDTREFAPYYQNYIRKVPEGNILEILTRQMEETQQLIQRISPDKEEYRYAPGKWSIKEVFGHVTDTERVFAYRALCFSRNDKTPLPSFEQDDYVSEGNFSQRSLKDIAGEFRLVRLSNIALFTSFDEELMMRRGIASGFEFTVRAILYIIAGHELHHRQILEERYL